MTSSCMPLTLEGKAQVQEVVNVEEWWGEVRDRSVSGANEGHPEKDALG